MQLDTAIFYTHNLDNIIKFYTETIHLTLEYKNGERYASFKLDNGSQLGIKVADKEREIPGGQTVILSTDNVDFLYEDFKIKNVTIYSEMANYDWGRNFSILDPDGNKVEFVQR